MRRYLILVALVGCTPEIFSGTYLCGPNQSCPEGQTCSGDGTCVLAGTETAFACDPLTQREPDDTAAQAFALPPLACVSSPYVGEGCLAAGDTQDWFKLHVPTGCVAVEVEARLTYPVSWEVVGFELWDLASMTMLATDTNCKMIATGGEIATCITFTVNTNADYGIVVKPKGGGNCDGRCSFNRYNLTVQLATPG